MVILNIILNAVEITVNTYFVFLYFANAGTKFYRGVHIVEWRWCYNVFVADCCGEENC